MRFVVFGAGGRGREAYGSWILRHPERASIVGVADADPTRRDSFAAAAGAEAYADWRELMSALPRLRPDAAIVALPDHLHVEPARALMELGIPTLLEKPIAPHLDELQDLYATHRRTGVPVTVGHVLRFTPFWQRVKDVLDAGLLGEIVTLEIRENIGFWHFAHSFVRGNWRRRDRSSPMVLAKTCHDLDLIRWLMDAAPRSVSSTGSLKYFTPAHAPKGAPEFCIEGCPAADNCPFYAPRYYMDALSEVHGVPVTLVTSDTSPEGRLAALHTSPYGRCVFRTDNDVADHQITWLDFQGGATASLVASGLTAENTRHLNITGTLGQLAGHMDDGTIVLDLFSPTAELPEQLQHLEVERKQRGPLGHTSITLQSRPERVATGDHRGHAGGDDALMDTFVTALENGNHHTQPNLSLEMALDSHYMAFAAEESRLTRRTIDFSTWLTDRRRQAA